MGLGSPIQAEDGSFAISYAPYGTSVGVAQPNLTSTNLSVSGGSLSAPTSLRLGDERIATPETESINGLAVTAVNADAIQGVGVDGGVSGSLAVNLSGSVGVINNHTEAYISNHATVNASNTGAAGKQGVLVAAGNDTSFLGIAGALSISGDTSITPGVVVFVLNNTVIAAINDGASVTAAGDIAVLARSSGEILSIAAAGAIAGDVAVGGAVAYVGVTDMTEAYIGFSAQTATTGTHANAGGNVVVDATDDTVAYLVTGSLAIGLDLAGIGGAVSVALLDKTTDAFIGSFATVNALGNSASLAGIYSGSMSGPGDFATLATFHGVAVQAETSENVTNIAVAGGFGYEAGLAGGVSVEIFNSNTIAYIGANANINTNSAGANSAQAVDVAAVNTATDFSFAGAIAGAAVAVLAGGVDVGLLNNSTTAYIGDDAVVDAKQGVDVFALSSDAVTSYGLSGGIAFAAASASVSDWSIGALFGDSYTDDGAPGSALPSGGISPDTDYTVGFTSQASSLIGSLTSSSNNGAAGNTQYITRNVSSAQTRVKGSISGDPVTTAVSSKNQPAGTVAYIASDVTVASGGSTNVQAKSEVSYSGTVGALEAGAVGLGASIDIVNVRGTTEAYINTGSTITAGGNVTVGAQLVGDNVNGLAFAGTGAIIGVGAQVIDIQDASIVSAKLVTGVVIPSAQAVQVTASTERSLNAQAAAGTVGGLVVGAAVAIADAKGSTTASSDAVIGQTGTVGSVGVTANSIDSTTADTWALSVGVVAGEVNIADAEVTPKITAEIGSMLQDPGHSERQRLRRLARGVQCRRYRHSGVPHRDWTIAG